MDFFFKFFFFPLILETFSKVGNAVTVAAILEILTEGKGKLTTSAAHCPIGTGRVGFSRDSAHTSRDSVLSG